MLLSVADLELLLLGLVAHEALLLLLGVEVALLLWGQVHLEGVLR